MITKFNEYKKLLEDEMIQPLSAGSGGSWIEKESLNKGALSKFFGGKGKEKTETDAKTDAKQDAKANATTEIDSTINQYSKLLTNTPILNMTAKTYAKLNNMIEKDSDSFKLKLDGDLDENSAMIDIAYKYYIKNITDIIIDIQDAPSDYMSEEVSEENFVKMTNNPVTIGTLVGNSITEWFSSKEPMSILNKSLYSSYIIPKGEIIESFQMYDDFLNEAGKGGRGGILTDLLNTYKKVKGTGSSVLGKSKYNSAYSEYAPISKKAGLNLSSNLGSSPTVSSNSSAMKAIEKTAPSSFSVMGQLADKGKGLANSAGGIFKNALNSVKKRTSILDGKISTAKDLFKGKIMKTTIGLVSLFYLPSFIINKVLTKWTGIFSSPSPEEDVVINFMMKFENDMVSRNLSPFTIYDKIYNEYNFNVEKLYKDKIIGWCESLYNQKIIDNQTFDICKRQINSEVFDIYLKESSYMSDKLTSYLENKWIDNITSPTPTLTIFSTMVMFFTLLERFEDQFYGGKVPIALPKEIAEIKRFDKEGNERDYLTVGDSGDDVAILQDMLKTLGVYKGELDGVYDSEISSLIADIKQNARSTDDSIIINGNTDRQTLKFIEKFLILKSNKLQGTLGGRKTIRQQELQRDAANLIG